ncbi:MAG: tail fiber domain-containing protein [Burkholderiales bacterium]|nr:tail fiber domain-containing protein [Burkholderiales bacterium]
MPSVLLAVVASILTLVATPTQAAPCAGFADIEDTDSFCPSVEWMKNRGITLGLTPTLYDPHSPLTRLQMAAFMYRLGFQNAFLKGGNAFGATAILGTTDNQALDIRVNNSRVMRYEPTAFAISPNVIGGHAANNASGAGSGATIGGGGELTFPNRVTSSGGTVAGGYDNSAGFSSSVGGGFSNIASGSHSTIGGGYDNTASGSVSFAAGSYANANGDNCAVFSLWGSSPGMQCFGIPGMFIIGAPNGFAVDYGTKRPDGGGFRYVGIGRVASQTIATWTGAYLSDNGVWQGNSDANAKRAFEHLDKHQILDRLLRLPIRSWSYRIERDGVRHVGPTAQDFHAAFGLGDDRRTIGMVDADGVALAAIQGLNAKLEAKLAERDAEIAELQRALAVLSAEVHRNR